MTDESSTAQRYQAAFEHAFDAIAIADDDGRYIEVNESFAELFGLPRAELIGRRISEFAPEDYDFEEAWRKFQASDRERDIFPLVRADGERRLVEYAATPNIIPGEHLSILRDVTERENRQQTITEQRDGMELLNQLVRHDIRNDLTVTAGYLELLDEQIDDTDAGHLAKAKASVESAIAVTDQARVMAEAMLRDEDQLEPVDLVSVLESQSEDIKAAYPNVTIDIERPQEDSTVLADNLIPSLFDNILTNAVIHNDKEPRIAISFEHDNDTVTVHIADNGPGIPDDRKESIFARQDRPDSDRATLGLYLVQTLVERYDGTVWVEDNDPVGSVFSVEFNRP